MGLLPPAKFSSALNYLLYDQFREITRFRVAGGKTRYAHTEDLAIVRFFAEMTDVRRRCADSKAQCRCAQFPNQGDRVNDA